MNKLVFITVIFSFFLSCNGQVIKKEDPNINLETINFKEDISHILNEFKLNLSEAKETDHYILSFIGDKSNFVPDENILAEKESHIIKFIATNDTYLDDVCLLGSELSFHYNEKNKIIGKYQLDIWNEKKGEELIKKLIKKLGEPKTANLIDYTVAMKHSYDDDNQDRKIEQTGLSWDNIDGKTYCLLKLYEKTHYLGHHLLVFKSNDNNSRIFAIMKWQIMDKLIKYDDK